MRSIALAVAVGVLAVGATGCGSGARNAIDPVAQAADATAKAGTSKVDITMQLAPNGRAPITITGAGVMDQSSGDAALTYDFSALTSRLGDQATGTTAEEVFKDNVIYMRLPVKGTPGGKPWMKIDLADAQKYAGLKQTAPTTYASPTDSIKALGDAGNSETVGQETVDGVQTTHYRTTVDVQKLLHARSENPARTQRVLRQSPFANVKQEQFDVWIDSDDLIRKLVYALGPTGTFAMTFSDFGVPANVTAPPEEETFDGVALMRQNGGG